MRLHEQAFNLAKEGKTNIEIFGALELSPAQLLRITISDTPLLYEIIKGRIEFLSPYIKLLSEEASDLVSKEAPVRNFRALQMLIERYDRENKALGIGYDMSLLTASPAPREQVMRGAELTAALRAAK